MRRRFGVVVSLVAITAACAACGSSGKSSPSAGASAPSTAGSSAGPIAVSSAMESLSVATVTSGSALTADMTIAMAKGFFTAHQLTVKLTPGAGANVPNLVVSGQDDIVTGDPTYAIVTAAKGKATTVVRGELGFGSSSDLATSPSITSVAQLKAKQGCKIAAFTQGSSAYGAALGMLKALDLSNCGLLTFATAPAVVGAVVSGSADGGVLAGAAWQSAITAGKIHLLLDSSKPADRALLGESQNFTGSNWYGLADTVKAKGSAIVKFIAGLNEAIQFMKSQTPQAVAAVLKTDPLYATVTADSLATGVAGARGYFDLVTGPGGIITETDWNKLLQALPTWGVPGYTPNAANDSYSNRVDMTYAKEALKLG